MMIRSLALVALALWIAPTLSGCGIGDRLTRSSSEGKEIRGTLTYRQRMALPPGATAYVAVVDITQAQESDVPFVPRVVTQHSYPARHQPPIPFALPYDPGEMTPNRAYALQARIDDADGKTIWDMSEPFVFDPWRHDTTVMLMLRPARGEFLGE